MFIPSRDDETPQIDILLEDAVKRPSLAGLKRGEQKWHNYREGIAITFERDRV